MIGEGGDGDCAADDDGSVNGIEVSPRDGGDVSRDDRGVLMILVMMMVIVMVVVMMKATRTMTSKDD